MLLAITILGALYSSVCALLLFPHLGISTRFSRAVLGLIALQVVSVTIWVNGHQCCGGAYAGDVTFTKPCSPASEGLVATVAILTATFFVVSAVYGLRAACRP